MEVLIQLDQSKIWDLINLSKPINNCIFIYEKQIYNLQIYFPRWRSLHRVDLSKTEI